MQYKLIIIHKILKLIIIISYQGLDSHLEELGMILGIPYNLV